MKVNFQVNRRGPIWLEARKCFSFQEESGDYRPVSLTSVPGKIMEKIILGVIEKHLKDNGNSQHGFIRRRSYLTKLMSFYNKFTCLVDQEDQ